MKAKHQRLILAGVALVAITGSSLLAMSALEDRASFFYSPSDVAQKGVEQGRAIRLGGMVPAGSIGMAPDGVTITFAVSDGGGTVPVRFKGVAPALFKEGSGVVAEGAFQGDTFIATNLLAKHDENYAPPKAVGEKHATQSLKP